MRIDREIKRMIQAGLGKLGYQIVPAIHPDSMAAALRRVAAAHPVETVIDVGASNGRWSELARRSYPAARYLLVEAQRAPHEPELRRLRARWPQLDYVLAAAGSRIGTIHFDASDPLGGAASETPFARNDVEVPVTTIDAEVETRRLPPRYLLKLDTHGFEVPILEGAAETLKRTEVVVVEAYNFTIADGSLRFHEMCRYLEERGFRCVDQCDIMRRPSDGALWQMDLVFVPAASAEFRSNTYA
jgi:FkbM family methyltransferase